jgi:signal transduction histidine kinase
VSVDPDGPTLRVSDRGPTIPAEEVAVLDAGHETPLAHGSGIGLWLVKWVADHSGATLTFERAEEGTTVELVFSGDAADDVGRYSD